MVYESALRVMGVKNIPQGALAQAKLFTKLNNARARKAGKETRTVSKVRIRTLGNSGEGW